MNKPSNGMKVAMALFIIGFMFLCVNYGTLGGIALLAGAIIWIAAPKPEPSIPDKQRYLNYQRQMERWKED
jgi:hypothetical protein